MTLTQTSDVAKSGPTRRPTSNNDPSFLKIESMYSTPPQTISVSNYPLGLHPPWTPSQAQITPVSQCHSVTAVLLCHSSVMSRMGRMVFPSFPKGLAIAKRSRVSRLPSKQRAVLYTPSEIISRWMQNCTTFPRLQLQSRSPIYGVWAMGNG